MTEARRPFSTVDPSVLAPVGGVPLDRIPRSRDPIHWAAQVAASLGSTLAEPAPDFSHTALSWDPATRGVVGAPIDGGWRAGVGVEVPELRLLGEGGEIVDRLAIDGATLDGAQEWLASALESARGTPAEPPLARPTHELPAHPIGDGATMTAGTAEEGAELAAWFGNAHAVLGVFEAVRPDASPVRIWPHHFDIASLVTLAGEGEEATTIGVGMTPGDGGYADPYWYLTPWPYPENPTPPDLPSGGHWHREGWFGAVLPGPALVAAGGRRRPGPRPGRVPRRRLRRLPLHPRPLMRPTARSRAPSRVGWVIRVEVEPRRMHDERHDGVRRNRTGLDEGRRARGAPRGAG